VFKAADRAPAITYIDMPQGLREQYQYYTQADVSRLRDAGYTHPFTRLEDGMADYVGRFLSQPDPYL
jgi:ADP-L-glycero-D-manno-heptose 6-epimerase